MNGANGEFESTGNPLVDAALSRLRERTGDRFKDLEDAMLVQSQIERRQTALLRDHSEWLLSNEKAIARHEAWLANHESTMARIDLTLAEVSDKLNLLIDREMKREGL